MSDNEKLFNRPEDSDRDSCTISLQPRHLLCMRCMKGGGSLDFMAKHGLQEVLEMITDNPDIHIRLEGAFDEMGARTPVYYSQTHEERKLDLDVLQKLGLAGGDTRTARELYRLLYERIPTLQGICTYDEVCTYDGVQNGKWLECTLARTKSYNNSGDVISVKRNKEEIENLKTESCKCIRGSLEIVIRAHHLLCMICSIGGDNNDKPLAKNNHFEVWDRMRNNPNIPVRIVEGPRECMICASCDRFLPARGLCIAACNLRDRKKDLDVMMKLGVKAGDTLPAEEIIALVCRNIPHVAGICDYDTVTSPVWDRCGGSRTGKYERGLEKACLIN